MSKEKFNSYLAKSDGTTLYQHTLDVKEAAEVLFDKLCIFRQPDAEQLKLQLVTTAVMHDLGKVHKYFQNSLFSRQGPRLRHEIISLWLCQKYLNLTIEELFAIATHHKDIIGSQIKPLDKDQITHHLMDNVNDERDLLSETLVKEWLAIFDITHITVVQNEAESFHVRVHHLLNKNKQENLNFNDKQLKSLSLLRSLMITADHLGSAGMQRSIPYYEPITLNQLLTNSKGITFNLRPFQESLLFCNSDVILHAPTGSGKTEAALAWVFANQSSTTRLYYLLPYTASINAMEKRLRQNFPRSLTIQHSKSLDYFYNQILEDEETNYSDPLQAQARASELKSITKEVFYPVKITTLFQMLRYSLKGKGWEMATIELQDALIIIDEFHAYEALVAGMMIATMALFKKMFNVKFFLMSATIPDFLVAKIVEVVFNGDTSMLRRPDIKLEGDKQILSRIRHQLFLQNERQISDDIELILAKYEYYDKILIVVNNVKSAQTLFYLLTTNNVAASEILLLHSGFNKKDRIEIEKKITSNLDVKHILIATQAVEVSLDIDYDCAFIEKAPVDALIQRFGRVNRAGKKEIAPVYLFQNIIGATPFYDKTILEKTWQELSNFNEQQLSEADLVQICNSIYKDGYPNEQLEEFNRGLDNSIIKNFESEWIAGCSNDWVESIVDPNKKVDVICSNLLQDYLALLDTKMYIAANQLLVSVYFVSVKEYSRAKDNTIIANDLHYNSQIGYLKKNDELNDQFL